MDARRFDDRTRRESGQRNLAIVMGGLLILLVGAVIFLIFSFNSRPSPVSAVATGSPEASASPSAALTTSAVMSLAAPSASLFPPPFATASLPSATPVPTAVPPTATPTAALPGATPTATPPPPLAGDEPAGAITIASIPFKQSLDVKPATAGASDERCDDERQSTDTVWFKYTAASDEDLGAYTAGSEYGTVLVAQRLNADGSTDMVGCNVWSPQDGSAVRVQAKSGVTYLFMVGSIGRRSGELDFALDKAPKPASVVATIAPFGTYDSFGTVNLTLETTCTGDVQYMSVDVELRQVVDRQVHTAYEYWDFSTCRRVQYWTLSVSSDRFVFGGEPATVRLNFSYSDRFESHWNSATFDVTLNPAGGTFPSPSPGPVTVEIPDDGPVY